MARKQSLSDLIQAEAQKFEPSAGEPTIEVSAQAVEEDTKPTAEASATKRSNPTKADLEVTIKELQADLAASQQNEKTLQQEIANLQSALAEQKATVERVTKELHETKQTALQLAEANSQLIEENKSVKQEQEAQLQKQQEKEKAKQPKPHQPVLYRKSHRTPEQYPVVQTNESKDDFSSNTWLYD
ncbi:hypothetical protein CLI64_11590 [Nostoc sp. CENA543]|uniref:hypothetical protein n=1 Tax=Nostoc sp. CENA543 TaxID=1869241 RepID=UPI000CA2B709|nr:hypothetical protein [Nostoc sp. CENA543]AUT00992.1 hypothetical protein CLI64_11590 [Nostoc sp. CENA543]